jgi:hypothetical protein
MAGIIFVRVCGWPSTRRIFGGDTILDGASKGDFESVTRYGATLSVPLAEGFSAKIAWSSWLTARNNGTYDTVLFTPQYRWFDR